MRLVVFLQAILSGFVLFVQLVILVVCIVHLGRLELYISYLAVSSMIIGFLDQLLKIDLGS